MSSKSHGQWPSNNPRPSEPEYGPGAMGAMTTQMAKRPLPEELQLQPPGGKRQRRDPSYGPEEIVNDKDLDAITSDWSRSLTEDTKRWANSIPRVSADELAKRVPGPPTHFNDAYTAEDEAQVCLEWQEDPLRRYKLDQASNSIMLRLWKLTQRIWPGHFPETIIGPGNMLAYEQESRVSKITVEGETFLNPHWTRNFCIDLEQLLVHPFWNGNLTTMITYIQYAVICRTNDQRGLLWPCQIPTDSTLWYAFRNVIGTKQNGTKSIVEIHSRAVEQIGNVTSVASQLLIEIERKAFKQDTPPFRPIQNNEPYKVRRGDLVTLKLALDDLRSNGAHVYQPCGYYHKVYAMALPSRGTAPEKATLETLREQVLIEQARQEFKANKAGLAAVANKAPLVLAPVVPHHIYDRKSRQQDEEFSREGSAEAILTTLSIGSRPLPKAANHQHYGLVDSGPNASGPKDHSLEDPGLMDTHLMDANIGDHKVVDGLYPVQGVNGLPFQPPPDRGPLKLTLFSSTRMFVNIMSYKTHGVEFVPRFTGCLE
ncbi:hypothetical protein BJ166DRAFT_599540 [Pestalotiopsis sp. NC0098]|nr:hypothetical protein BJ166DRAFT_599540 [Pestalotiopsis sp. NC0098]